MHNKSKQDLEMKPRELGTTSITSKMLLSAFERAKREIDGLSFIKNKRKNQVNKPKSQENLDDIKHNNHLEKIKAEQRKNEKKAFELYKLQVSKSMIDENKSEKKFHSNSQLAERLSYAKQFKMQQEILEDMYSKETLDLINDKLEKSFVNYNKFIQNKKNTGYKPKKRALSVNKVYEQEIKEKETLMKILFKRQASQIRKNKFMQELEEKFRKNREKKEKKIQEAQKFKKKQEKQLIKKCFDVENKIKQYQDVIHRHQSDLNEKLKIKFKYNKLKELDALKNYEKNKMIE
jgi:hypothetical protein